MASPSTLQSNHVLPTLSFLTLLSSSGSPKARSRGIHAATYVPLLAQDPVKPISLLLSSTKVLERFKMTGADTPIGYLAYPTALKARVSGDCVKHVIFLFGNPRSVLPFAARRLRDQDINLYRMVLEAVQRMAPEAQVLVGRILPRKDVKGEIVEASNGKLRQSVEDFNRLDEVGCEIVRLHCVPRNPGTGLEYLVDHVHLEEEGYKMYAETIHESLRPVGMGVSQRKDREAVCVAANLVVGCVNSMYP